MKSLHLYFELSIYSFKPIGKIQEKAPYVAKAEKRKVEYEKNMKAYNKKQVFYFKCMLLVFK